MSTLKLKKKVPEWRKHFRPNKKADPAKVKRLMTERYPHLFGEIRPLEVGVHRKILEDPKRPVTRKQARLFLHRWTNQPQYRSKRDKGEPRVAFDE